jgi:FkbM family methyltransferase
VLEFGRLRERLRFEVARRLNPYRTPQAYRWARITEGDRLRIILRNAQGLERELRLRAKGSDFTGFLQVFDPCQYDTGKLPRDRDLRRRYEAILRDGKRPLIIDAGANIGMAALYYRDVYPEAAILCIEPQASNYAELSRNVAGDELIVPLQAAVSRAEGTAEVTDPGWGDLGFRTSNVGTRTPNGVPAHNLRTLLALAQQQWPAVPFILKIDIEGGEAGLFDADASIIDRFYAVVIEPHDWLMPKQRTAASFLKAVAARDRDLIILGENLLSISNEDPDLLTIAAPTVSHRIAFPWAKQSSWSKDTDYVFAGDPAGDSQR